MIDKYDANENGVMDFDEYAKMIMTIQAEIAGLANGEISVDDFIEQYTSKEVIGLMVEGFDIADVDDNGTLDRQELAATFAYQDYSDAVYDDNFNKIDSDGTLDGKIDVFKDAGNDPNAKSNIAMFFDFLFN